MKKNPPNVWVRPHCVKKMLQVMRLALLFVVLFFTSASAFTQRVSLSVKAETTLNEVLKQVKDQTGVRILYDAGKMKRVPCREMKITDLEIAEALKQILKDTRFEFFEEGGVFIVREASLQQAKVIRLVGKVTDEKKQPLPGVTVQLKGFSVGTATNGEGRYQLSIPNAPEKFSLVFSFVGMVSQEIVYAGKDTIDVVMKEDVETLDDVVVTGYMTLDKSKYVGAINKVYARDIMIPGESTIDQMLQGVIPGMAVRITSGMVGSTPKIRIRGTSTLLGSQDPVWVVDGVIQRDPLPISETDASLSSDLDNLRDIAANAISWLNPSDIESLTVLKDASATAIYGSKAANGVIVINTKKAQSGSASLSYSGSFSIGQRPRYGLYNQMNSRELMDFSREMYEDRVRYPSAILPIGYAGLVQKLTNKEITHEQLETEYNKMANNNTDWFDLLFRNSFNHKHNLSITGGSEKIASRASIGITEEKGEAKGNEGKTFTGSSNTVLQLIPNLRISLNLNGSYREMFGFAYGVSPFSYAYNTARTIPLRNEDGTLYYHEKWGGSSTAISGKSWYGYNILNEINNTGNENRSKMVSSSLDVSWKILPYLEYQGLVSYTVSSSEVKSYATEYSNYITSLRGYEVGEVTANSDEEKMTQLPFGGLLVTENATTNTWSVRNSLVFNKLFKDVHSVTLQVGFEVSSNTATGSRNTRYGYLRYRGEAFASVPTTYTTVYNAVAQQNPLLNTMRTASSVTNRENNYVSEFLTAVYSFDNRYVVNFNARLDASNRFGQDKNDRFEPTWSIGAKWRVGSESFARNWNWMESLDISGSYGYQGNSVEEVSPYLIASDGGLNQFYNQYTLNIKYLPYEKLGWEKTKSWNASVDLSFLKGRMNVVFNAYGKKSDVIASRQVPGENGMLNSRIFGTEMDNKGYEVTVNFIPVRTQDWTWSFSVNTGKVTNEISDNERVNKLEDFLDGSAVLNGKSYNSFYSFRYKELSQENGEPLFYNMDIEKTNDFTEFLVRSGNFDSDFTGGFNTQVRYKRLSFTMQFAMQFGGQDRLPELYTGTLKGVPGPQENVSRQLKKRWRKAGDQTNIPAVPNYNSASSFGYVTLPVLSGTSSMTPYAMYSQSDLRVADTDLIRCRQISLTYSVGESILKALHLKYASISWSMSNPFMIAFDKAWKGLDPETKDWPARRTTSLSLNVTF